MKFFFDSIAIVLLLSLNKAHAGDGRVLNDSTCSGSVAINGVGGPPDLSDGKFSPDFDVVNKGFPLRASENNKDVCDAKIIYYCNDSCDGGTEAYVQVKCDSALEDSESYVQQRTGGDYGDYLVTEDSPNFDYVKTGNWLSGIKVMGWKARFCVPEGGTELSIYSRRNNSPNFRTSDVVCVNPVCDFENKVRSTCNAAGAVEGDSIPSISDGKFSAPFNKVNNPFHLYRHESANEECDAKIIYFCNDSCGAGKVEAYVQVRCNGAIKESGISIKAKSYKKNAFHLGEEYVNENSPNLEFIKTGNWLSGISVKGFEAKFCLPKGDNGIYFRVFRKDSVQLDNFIKDVCTNPVCPNDSVNLNNGNGGGDPHFKTFDGTQYSYHGECDLVMARSPSFANNLGLDLHIRTKGMGTWSLISNAALRIGDDIFEFLNDGSSYINGSPAALPYDMAGSYTVTKKRTITEKQDGEGNFRTIDKTVVHVHLGPDKFIRFSRIGKGIMFVKVGAFFEDTEGMLGIHGVNGMVGRDRQTVLNDPNEMGAEWQVNNSEPMLFRESRAPQFPQSCILPQASAINRRLRKTDTDMHLAETACEPVADEFRGMCLEDVLLSGDIHSADGYLHGEAF